MTTTLKSEADYPIACIGAIEIGPCMININSTANGRTLLTLDSVTSGQRELLPNISKKLTEYLTLSENHSWLAISDQVAK